MSAAPGPAASPDCPVCGAGTSLLDVVDFNKSCEEARGLFLPLSGEPVYYALCGKCGFCFAPGLHRWPLEAFASRIYNDEYARVDPDYLEVRPRANAATLRTMFKDLPRTVKHLDYGGGQGLLSRLLRESGWDSTSWDPFVDRKSSVAQLGKFDLVTAYEVFEHVPDVQALMSDLEALLAPDGVVLFSTLLSDGNIRPNERLSWWYASPRNGHISLFSRESLALLAQRHGFTCGSFSGGFHVLFRAVPPWAAHVLRTGSSR